MTAEIAVLNRNGIALAADSAVSVGAKIYNSANKLFALTKFHPVGIMVFGNAHFMGVPWETIIKFYRQNVLKTRQLSTIGEYLSDFVIFLSTSSIIDSTGEREYVQMFAYKKLSRLVKKIKDEVEREIRSKGKITSVDTETIVAKYVLAWLDMESKEPMYFPRGMRQYLEREYKSDVIDLIPKIMSNLPLSKMLQTRLPGAILDSFGRQRSTLAPSGIVIAGFGEDEVFPAVAVIKVDGKIRRHVRIVQHYEEQVNQDSSAGIMPFAQREMVDLVMKGCDPGLYSDLINEIRNALSTVCDNVVAATGAVVDDAIRKKIAGEVSKVADEFRNKFDEQELEDFVHPVLRGVASLPLDELAAMAESLVNLTSFKRRVTPVPESVGGPVDVAVISKGDGFIWIKRKHYFSPELNPHFFRQFSNKEQS